MKKAIVIDWLSSRQLLMSVMVHMLPTTIAHNMFQGLCFGLINNTGYAVRSMLCCFYQFR